jgi:thioredoxin-dependent peroxiredoxin
MSKVMTATTNDISPRITINSCRSGAITLPNKNAKYTILYFYPKDDTSGCTIEAKDFSELLPEFNKLDSQVFGISKDNITSHEKFIKKHDLKIDLLSDESDISEQFGVWKEKNMYGKKYMGIERTTFVISTENKIIKAWHKVSVKEHAKEVLEFIKSLN